VTDVDAPQTWRDVTDVDAPGDVGVTDVDASGDAA